MDFEWSDGCLKDRWKNGENGIMGKNELFVSSPFRKGFNTILLHEIFQIYNRTCKMSPREIDKINWTIAKANLLLNWSIFLVVIWDIANLWNFDYIKEMIRLPVIILSSFNFI